MLQNCYNKTVTKKCALKKGSEEPFFSNNLFYYPSKLNVCFPCPIPFV